MTVEVFTDDPNEGGTLLRASPPIQIAASGSTTWVVDPPLADDDTFYWWRAAVLDSRGGTSSSAAQVFRVNLGNDEPSVPELVGPLDGAVVTSLQPELGATGAQDADGELLTYDLTPAFNSAALQSGAGFACGLDGESACFTPPLPLLENTRYWWRARCSDGFSLGEPALATFFVDLSNDPPSPPTALSPNDALTLSATPTLVALAAVDPEVGALEYEFQVLDGAGTVVQSASGVTPLDADDATVSWTVEAPLAKGEEFAWQARAVDPLGLAGAWSAAASFEVYEKLGGGGGGGGCAVAGLRRHGAASIFTGMAAVLLIGLRRRGCGNFEKRSTGASWC